MCILGYETRSWYLLSRNFTTRNKENTLIFNLETHENAPSIIKKVKNKQIKIIESAYNGIQSVKTHLIEFIKKHSCENEELNIHIDYSSMPRSWYCSLPFILSDISSEEKSLYFWYVAGTYPYTYNDYPTAGIDSISVFSGLSLPTVDKRRFHVIGLGYDDIRTETMISIIEPESLISCYAYNPFNTETKEGVCKANKNIMSRSLFTVALQTDNFCGLVDNLCELAINLMQNGQVIVVPDGPKPLIMAMSLIPDIIKKAEITCLHISRNSSHFSKINVTPRKDEIYGFKII